MIAGEAFVLGEVLQRFRQNRCGELGELTVIGCSSRQQFAVLGSPSAVGGSRLGGVAHAGRRHTRRCVGARLVG